MVLERVDLANITDPGELEIAHIAWSFGEDETTIPLDTIRGGVKLQFLCSWCPIHSMIVGLRKRMRDSDL